MSTASGRKNGTAVVDATNLTFTVTGATVADNNTKYSVVVNGAQGTVTSQDAVLTVTPDTALPTVLSAKGSPNRTEVAVTFSEPVDQASANTAANYRITSASGNLNVTSAALASNGTQALLTTAQQALGTKYTLVVSNVKDTAATPNMIAAGSKAVFIPTGKLLEQNGFIVFEAENFDRNLDGLWVRDTQRGIPSGGASMVVPNGAGGSESATKLEYDVEFKQAATYTVWFRASGADGGDDSGWFHLDGERPAERAAGNGASMTGFQPQTDFVWRSDSQDGPDPFTVDIATPGVHTVAVARREDGSFFDKFILTTQAGYNPTGLGPPETREGAPGLPTVSVAAPTGGQVFATGSNITLSATAKGDAGLDISRVEYTANGTVIGQATATPFSVTWTNVQSGIFSIRARAIDEIGQVTASTPVTVTVGTPPPQALLVAAAGNLNASDAGVKARLESKGWQVRVVEGPASVTSDADGKQLIIVSSTVSSGDVAVKFRDVAVPVINWEQALQDDFLMTGNGGTDRGETADPPTETQIDIIRADHPLAAGLSTGLKTVVQSSVRITWGSPNANAVKIATVAGNPDQVAIYGYDTGATMADGSFKAPARRMHIFLQNVSFEVINDTGRALFDAAVEWASGIAPKPAKKIVWVSFHEADDKPDATSAGVGMTVASDKGYTALLRAQGYNVTRYLTTATPDAAVLNAADLVIVSRAVPSGNFQNAAATAWNTTVKAPMIVMGGYVLRNSRMGFTTGGTIPDTTGDIRLKVNTPSHPIFTGIPLDANSTMVNVYAGVESFFGQDPPLLQRGISVNTDPVAGNGVVLATVGTAADPTFGGTIIGEWQAGAVMGNGTADVLAGRRLVFLSGSREASSGFTGGNTAGFYDLEPDGEKMFLNAVAFMLGAAPPAPAPKLSVSRTATGLSITFTGTLQSATSVTGPWADEAGATSPLTVNPTQGLKFYRAKQ